MVGDTTVSILRRLIEQSQNVLTPEAARSILEIQFSETDQARVRDLASRSSHGTLTAQEAIEYDGYIIADDVLSLWQSKARRSLQNHPSAA